MATSTATPRRATTKTAGAKNAATKGAAKKAAAKKAPAKKAAKDAGQGGRQAGFQPEQVITLLVDKNPKRESSASHAEFKLYKNGMTVEKALKAGVRSASIRWDSDHGFIQVK